ncbi:hypothetical protein SLA2020_404990 [Shorea laevis]
MGTPDARAHHPATADPQASTAVTEGSVLRNISFETSLRNRIKALVDRDSLFIQWEGDYWGDIKASLDSEYIRVLYNSRLDFESGELQLRELQDQAASLFKIQLIIDPALLNRGIKIDIDLDERIYDYFAEINEQMDKPITGREGLSILKNI